MNSYWRKPIEFSDEVLEQASAQAETFRNYFVGLEHEPQEIERDALARVLDDDFNTAEALRLFHDWRARGRTDSLRWGLEVFGLGAVDEAVSAPGALGALGDTRHEP